MPKEGTRVGAIYSTDGEGVEICFLGYGTYVGETIPSKDAVGAIAEQLRKLKKPNSKIILDNGKEIWGCECWWTEEAIVKEELEAYKSVKIVDIDDIREEYRNKNGEFERAKIRQSKKEQSNIQKATEKGNIVEFHSLRMRGEIKRRKKDSTVVDFDEI